MKKKKKSSSVKIAIVVSRFNEDISGGLLHGALEALEENNISNKSINVVSCPGAFEIPLTVKKLLKKKKYDAVICLGAVIKGETAHFEYISYAVTKGILQLNLDSGIPVTFGVLTCYNEEQAQKRASSGDENKGREAALAALDMINLLKEI
ncbi:MAG TPA: 6,7-dimethyl-8-ribityllumazine synthase [Ignavibacteria bacterium]|nr:6,7-dimethyl-8-ribityllumazine synthase [Ignavibacteria bacterium]